MKKDLTKRGLAVFVTILMITGTFGMLGMSGLSGGIAVYASNETSEEQSVRTESSEDVSASADENTEQKPEAEEQVSEDSSQQDDTQIDEKVDESSAAEEQAETSDDSASDVVFAETEALEEESEAPVAVVQKVKIGDASITAEYQSDVFADEVTFKADKLSKKQIKKSSEAVNELVGDDHSATVVFAYDLYFVDKSGNRLEPSDDVKITIAFKEAPDGRMPGDLRVVHIKDNGTAEYVDDASVSDDASVTEFTNDQFSEYDVIAESGSIVTVSSETELNAVVADLNANGGEKAVELSQDITYESNRSITLTKGELTVLGEGHQLKATFYLKNDAILNLGIKGYNKTLKSLSSRSDYGVISAQQTSTLNIYDGVTIGPSSCVGASGGITTANASVINMYGGVITDCHSSSVSGGVYITNNAVFNMRGGTIEDCTGYAGGAVGLAGGTPFGGSNEGKAQFNMSGGTIKDCTDAWIGGGAVSAYTAYPVVFNMSGGTIENCNSTNYGYGGAVCLYTTSDTTFIMDGGEIINSSSVNSRAGYGGGLFIYAKGANTNIQLNSGAITENSASIGGGIMAFAGNITISDGFGLHNNTASAGDDIYNAGGSIKLGTVVENTELKSTGQKITDWYIDGNSDGTDTERWACKPYDEANFLEQFEHTGEVYSKEYGLKAAHGEPVVTVKFDPDEGTPDPDDQEVKYNESATRPSIDPSKTGFTFVDWFKKIGQTIADIAFDFTSKITEDTELKAKYNEHTYTIIFDGNADNATGSTASIENVKYTEKKTLTENGFTREGYTFTGWNSAADGRGTPYADKAEVEKLTAEDKATITMYAQWEANDTELTYKANGGEGTMDKQTGKVDETVKTAENGFTREGYTFKDWNTKNDGSGDSYAENADYVLTAGTDELYAQWTPNSYKVHFDKNSSNATGSMEDQSFTYDEEKALTANTFTREGYTFTGWNTKDDGTGTDYADEASVKNLTAENGGEVTLYAQWTANDTKLIYNANGGEGTMAEQNGKVDETVKTAENGFTREGYTFTDWNTKDDASGDSYAENADYTLTAGVNELYAQWTPNSYKVHFDKNSNKATGEMTDQSFNYDEEKALTANAFAREGYTFTGWNTKDDGTGTGYADKASVKNLTAENGGEVTLYAQWTANSYKVHFDRNNDNATGSMADQSFDYDEEKALTANAFTCEGYTFTGWNTKDDGTGIGYADKASVKNLTAENGGEVTLYAQWTPNSYIVKFEANKGSGSMDDQPFNYDEKKALTANGFAREGYSFNGWNTKADGTGTDYADKASVKNLTTENDGVVTLYAQWTPNKYKVHFDKNSGNATGSMDDQAFEYDEEKALTANAFAREGYTFTSWNTKADGTGTEYADKASVKNLTAENGGEVTLYAQWEANDTELIYHANGGEGTMAEQAGKVDETVKTADNGFTREGYTFTEWNTKADGTGTKYDENADYVLTAGTDELYAQWTPNAYTVHFDKNSDKATGSMDDQAFTYDEEKALTTNAFAREGYTFTGWNTKADGSGTGYADKASVKNLTTENGGEVTLFAQWTASDTKLTYNANGGTGTTAEQTGKVDETVKTATNGFTREGYTFKDWNTKTDGTGDSYDENADYVLTAGVSELYAQWTPNAYTVHFDKNSDQATGNMSDQSFLYDEEKALTANAFTREGYTFTGWNTKADGSGTEYADEASVRNLTAENGGEVTLFAQWTASDTKLTYNANGGTGTTAEQTGKVDETVKTAANGFTRAGYTFTGWNTKADGSGDSYDENADYVLTAGVNELYAQWTANEYTITFDTGGGTEIDAIVQPDGSIVIAPQDPTRAGYDFAGWSPEIPKTMPAEDITITARWTPRNDTPYVVRAYYQNKGSYNVTPVQINLKGTTDTEANVDKYKTPVRDGYALDESRNEAWSGIIAGDGSLVLEVYFKQQFTVTYSPGSYGTFARTSTGGMDYNASTPAAPGTSGESGYRFTGWSPQIADRVTKNVTYVAQWARIPAPEPEPDDDNNRDNDGNGGGNAAPAAAPAAPAADNPAPPATPNPPQTITDPEPPLAAPEPEDTWALINLIAMILTVAGAAAAALRRRKDDDEEEDENGNREEEEGGSRWSFLAKAVGILLAIISILIFILTEDLTLKMALIDEWTILMLIILALQIASHILAKRLLK